jgi:hypothetical protein
MKRPGLLTGAGLAELAGTYWSDELETSRLGGNRVRNLRFERR